MRRSNPIWRVIGLLAVVVILAAGLAYTTVSTVRQTNELCGFQHRSWDIQHQQILDDAVPQKPTEAVLRAFPAIRPFYDPKNPLYAEQVNALNHKRDRQLRVLGSRPNC